MAQKKKKVEFDRMNDEEIVRNIREKAEQKGVNLTPKQGFFAIKLFDYALKKGIISDDAKFYLFLTVDEMVAIFGCSKAFVSQTLILLNKAEIISRTHISTEKGIVDSKMKVTKIECGLFCRVS